MFIFVTIIHVIVCLFLVLVVLLQSGKAADLAGAFGGLGSQTVFGPRGSATVLTRATTVSAILFMITSISLSILSTGGPVGGGGNNILDKITAPASTAPASKGPVSGAPAPGQLPTSLPAEIQVDGKNVQKFDIPVTSPTDQKGAPKAPAAKK